MRIPLFPLQSVFFPGERVPLHIFEERYKQLIADCKNEAMTFGVPVFHNNTMTHGTELELQEIITTYDSGALDVICLAKQVFRVVTFDNQMENKLYAGGLVEFLENYDDGLLEQKEEVLLLINELYRLMHVPFAGIPPEDYNSYTLVHKIGLSLNQEHQLLQLLHETERLSFLKMHLTTTITVLKQVNRTKEIIEMNGHFKNFDPLDFKNFEL